MTTTKKQDQSGSTSGTEGIKSYFKGVKSEWGKIAWPEKNQVIGETIIVLIIVFFFTALVFVLDIGFEKLFSELMKIAH